MKRRLTAMAVASAAVVVGRARCQWLKYPTPGIPRLPDGRPDLSAPAPRELLEYICNENNRYFEIVPKK